MHTLWDIYPYIYAHVQTTYTSRKQPKDILLRDNKVLVPYNISRYSRLDKKKSTNNNKLTDELPSHDLTWSGLRQVITSSK